MTQPFAPEPPGRGQLPHNHPSRVPVGDKPPLPEERREPPGPAPVPEGEPPPPREPEDPPQQPPVGDPLPGTPPIGDPRPSDGARFA